MGHRKLSIAIAVLPALVSMAQVISVPAERELKVSKAEVVSLAVAPKGDRLLVGLNKGAELYDLETGKRIFALPYNEDGGTAVYHVAFNDNGEYAVLIGHSGKRVVWSMKTGKPEPSLVQHRWVPDPRAVKAMGLDMSNSTFDRFYQQVEVKQGDRIVQSTKGGMVNVLDAEGMSVQKLEQPDNKDQHHVPPVLLWQQWLLTGTDDGRVLFYTVR
ncbi:MAG: hypothetical protein IPL52_14070 [Flavobacteriales bacterium]|nr:hypothetical protein [Flavobacteriales bacterium]